MSYMDDAELASMTTTSSMITNLIGHRILVLTPFQLHFQLLQTLRPRQGCPEAINPPVKVVVCLVEDLLILNDIKDLCLSVKHLLSKQKGRELFNWNL